MNQFTINQSFSNMKYEIPIKKNYRSRFSEYYLHNSVNFLLKL